MTETTILDDRAVDAMLTTVRADGNLVLTLAERDALCATVKHLRAQVDKFSTLADERHDLLSSERRANDELRCERAKILQSLERAQQERNRLGTGLVNLYHVTTGETCDQFVALGMATSAVSSLQSQLEQLRAGHRESEKQLREWQDKVVSLMDRLAQVEQERDELRGQIERLNTFGESMLRRLEKAIGVGPSADHGWEFVVSKVENQVKL